MICKHCELEEVAEMTEYVHLDTHVTVTNYCEQCLFELDQAINDVFESFIQNDGVEW